MAEAGKDGSHDRPSVHDLFQSPLARRDRPHAVFFSGPDAAGRHVGGAAAGGLAAADTDRGLRRQHIFEDCKCQSKALPM